MGWFLNGLLRHRSEDGKYALIHIPTSAGFVVNTATGRPQAGVKIYRIDGSTASHTRTALESGANMAWANSNRPAGAEIASVTDITGEFDLSGEPNGSSGYIIDFAGRPVNSEILTMDVPLRGTHSQVRIDAPVSLEVNSIELSPGQTCQISPEFNISLADTAAGSWRGSASQSLDWPEEFGRAEVVGGIYTTSGPQSTSLTAKVVVEPEIAEYYAVTGAELSMISAEEGSAEWQYLEKDLFEADLVKGELSITSHPTPGVKYAVA